MRHIIIFLCIFLAAQTAFSAELSLPVPTLKGAVSVEETLSKRRSIRSYTSDPLTIQEVSQLLWAGQGITGSGGKRTAPSAGASYPLTLYLVAGNVTGLASGAYRYSPEKNYLEKVADGDLRTKLMQASSSQRWVGEAPITIIFAADYGRSGRYGTKARQYVDFEVGHAAQNIMLQAVALNLGTVAIGSFSETSVRELIKIPANQTVVYLVPAGHPK